MLGKGGVLAVLFPTTSVAKGRDVTRAPSPSSQPPSPPPRPRSDIRAAVMSGNLRPECAVINATLAPEPLAVQAAAFKALQAQNRFFFLT